MKLRFWAGVALLVAASAIPSVAQAKEKHTADIQVENKTGHEIEFVTVAHKYGNDYKQTKTWSNLGNGRTTRQAMQVDYNTGFGTTGADWWVVTWKYKGDDTLYVTDPAGLRKVVDAGEKFSRDTLPVVA